MLDENASEPSSIHSPPDPYGFCKTCQQWAACHASEEIGPLFHDQISRMTGVAQGLPRLFYGM